MDFLLALFPFMSMSNDFSFRISALDLLLNMGAEIEGEAVMAALVAAVGRHLEASNDTVGTMCSS